MQNSLENKSVCFIANFYKTYFFQVLADHLVVNGVRVLWIVPKKSQLAELQRIYGEDNVLGISRDYMKHEYDADAVGDYRINEIIFGDRVLRNEVKNGQRFLRNIQKPIYDFIDKNGVSLIIGEVTWAHELLIHRMVSRSPLLGCRYYSMHTIRIPNGRFAFFEDEKQSRIVPRKCAAINKIEMLSVEKPSYLIGNDLILKKQMTFGGRFRRLKRFFTGENIEKSDPNVNVGGRDRWFFPLKEELNRVLYGFLPRKELDEILGKPFVLFGFHKQPEASIDVSGRYFEDQRQNVLNLWRQLPEGWNLVVKEHSNAVGDRGIGFYRELASYPGVIIANERIDSHRLIEECQLVATNTGTMALEAALLGCPAITFSPVFFNKHNYCCNVDWVKMEEYLNLESLISEIKSKDHNSVEYTEYIISNSYEGVISDVVSNPSVVDPGNVVVVSEAILSVL